MAERSLGRRVPSDFTHVDRYPITTSTAPPKPVPGVVGVDWYGVFDRPVRDRQGHWWVGVDESLRVLPSSRWGGVRGGHCFAFKARGAADPTEWWEFYDQDDPNFVVVVRSPYAWKPGGCTGFGTARMLSLLNRKRYDPYFIYGEDQKIDEWPGEDYEGSSVRAALDVVRTMGARPIVRGVSTAPRLEEGIAVNRWARSIEDFAQAVGYADKGYLDGLNSWGRSGYPHLVRWPMEVLSVLHASDGEFGIVTDR